MALHDIFADSLKVTAGEMTAEEALDPLRKKVIAAMLHGSNLGINLDKTFVDFKGKMKNGPVNWDSEVVFNFAEFRKKDNYRKILMDEDLKDVMGNDCQR